MKAKSLARRARWLVGQSISPIKAAILTRRYPQLSNAFAVVSHLTTEERVALYRLARRCRTICEIGSYIGASACCFGAAMQENGDGKVLCVDTWNNDAMTEGRRETFAEFRRNTDAYERFIVPIRGLSTEVVDEVTARGAQLDLLFIDGDHSYEGVKADWESYRSLLRGGSIVVFHDWGWASGVRRVIEDDVAPLVAEQGMLPNMWWGTLKS